MTSVCRISDEIWKKENEKEKLEESRALVVEEMNWLSIVNDENLDF